MTPTEKIQKILDETEGHMGSWVDGYRDGLRSALRILQEKTS